jgi:hypothetical protein
MQQQSALLCEDFIDSAHEDMGGDEQSNFHVKESVDIELDASNSADTHHQVGILPDPNEGNTPICKTNEKCPSTQGSSSVNSHFPMTQQLPDFDYFTQVSKAIIDRNVTVAIDAKLCLLLIMRKRLQSSLQ